MRILHVIAACASGGAEVFVKDLAIEMERSGHPQAVAYLSGAADLGSSVAFERNFIAELRGGGVASFEIGHASRKNPVFGAFSLQKTIRQFQAELLHIHLGRAMLSRALLPRPIPTVFSYHNSVAVFDVRFFWLFDRLVDRYIAICGPSEEFLASVTSKVCRRIYNGIHPDRIKFPGVRRKARKLKILCVGNLRRQKHYPTVIEVAHMLRERLPPATIPEFRIAGDGAERNHLERLIAERNLGKVVRLLGARSDIADLMAESDVLLNTSSFEGLPISLLEAARSGLPVIATDVGGVSEVVIEGKSGFLVPFDRPGPIVERILHLMEDDTALEELSRESRRLSERFLLEPSVREHLDLYSDVLDGAAAERYETGEPVQRY